MSLPIAVSHRPVLIADEALREVFKLSNACSSACCTVKPLATSSFFIELNLSSCSVEPYFLKSSNETLSKSSLFKAVEAPYAKLTKSPPNLGEISLALFSI